MATKAGVIFCGVLILVVVACSSTDSLDESAAKRTFEQWMSTKLKGESRSIQKTGPLFVKEGSASMDFTITPRPDPPSTGGIVFVPADDTEYAAQFEKAQNGKWYLVRVTGRRGNIGDLPNLEVK